MTEISLTSSLPKSPRDALLVGLLSQEDSPVVLESDALPGKSGGALLDLALAVGATGKANQVQRAPGGALGYRVVVFTGLGEAVTLEKLRQAAGSATRVLQDVDDIDVVLPAASAEAVGAIAEGLALGAYRFERYKTQKAAVERAVVVSPVARSAEAKAAHERAAVVAEAVNATRELVNTPANDLYPETFADLAANAAAAVGLTVTVLDEKQLAKGGFGGLLGVGKGSTRPPRLVKVEYRPRNASRHVALVGKGITFDTGGLSLKPPASMETMKTDMAGAAAVLNTIVAAARLQLPVRVTAWLAMAENMPSGTATRPSDIITIRGGKTVEVLNTDAEGRLVLADALVAAAEEEPDTILDIATLTGAQIIALGERVGGVMGDDDTRSDVVAAAEASGEQFWPMPLPEHLFESLKTPYADLKNKGSREGGMLVGGLFLRHFVPDRAWAHLDIAGPSWTEKAWGYTAAGGTGAGVRTMLGYLENVEG
ncbi:MAG TPA: leucyl aminopeptidase [Actinomycetaceae bacterium]|nr:leucyl aminopeptidase [Actinomycetaceae bacterium]